MGDQVQSGKFLKDSDWVRRAENGHGACKANVFCARSRCAQDDRRSRIHELTTVVFPDAKDIEANLVGQGNLIQQIVHALDSANGQTRSRVRDDCSEAVDADLHFCNP
jgi:hypothetical protein